MRPDDILDMLRRQPFLPFRLYLSNGTTYDIRHPEIALVTRAAIVIGIPGTASPEDYPDRFAIVAHPLDAAFGKRNLRRHLEDLIFERCRPQVRNKDVHLLALILTDMRIEVASRPPMSQYS